MIHIASCKKRQLKPFSPFFLRILFVAFLATTAHPTATHATAPVDRVAGQVLVRFSGLSCAQLQLSQNALESPSFSLHAVEKRTRLKLRFKKTSVLNYALYEIRDERQSFKDKPTEDETLTLIQRLAQDPSIERIAENRWYHALRVPNDEYYPLMWHLDRIGAEAAWNISVGTSTQRVGVVDTGIIRNHQDLNAKDIGGYDFLTCDPNFDNNCGNSNDGDGRDNDYNDPGDACNPNNGDEPSFHGTHVSGTILASTQNSVGIAGVNWNAQLMTVRALGRCGGSTIDITEGALWLAGLSINGVPDIGANKVSIMNLSLGSNSTQCSQYEQDGIDYINRQGILFVAASGNDGGPVLSPATCTGVVSVAAHDRNGNLTSYSSFGPEVEVVAPGGDIQGSGANENGILSTLGPEPNRYYYYEGTSMAAPHVTGALSVAQALYPSLSFSEIRQLFIDTGDACGNCQGVPTLRLDRILTQLENASTDPVDPPPVDPPPASDDAFEENDTAEQATPMICGRQVELYAKARDQDWFSVHATIGTTLQASIQSANGGDVDLYILENEQTTAVSDSPTGQENVSVIVTAETQFLVVDPFVNPDTGIAAEDAYTLTILCESADPTNPADAGSNPTNPADAGSSLTNPADAGFSPTNPDPNSPDLTPANADAAEPNNSASTAFPLQCGGQGFFNALDEDYYRLALAEPSALKVVLESASVLNLQLRSTDGQTTIAEGMLIDDQNIINEPALAKGEYLLWIPAAPQRQDNSYSLTIECAETAKISTGCSHIRGLSPDSPDSFWAGLFLFAFLTMTFRRRAF